jgi:hypothetical protein
MSCAQPNNQTPSTISAAAQQAARDLAWNQRGQARIKFRRHVSLEFEFTLFARDAFPLC